MNDIVIVNLLYQGLSELTYLTESLPALKEQGDVTIIPMASKSIEHNGSMYYILCNVKMTAEAATALMLKSKFFSDRMRITYISDDFKNTFHN